MTKARKKSADIELDDNQKSFIVQRLAMFDPPTAVANAVKEEFGITVSRQAVQFYDPTVGQKPAEKWCAMFEAARKAFLDSYAEIPIAQRSVRLRHMDQMLHNALFPAKGRRKNFGLAAQMLVEAAKEVGDVYTNNRKVALSGSIGIEAWLDEVDDK